MVETVHEFTLLNPGSIFDIFQSGRKFYGPRVRSGPLSLPEDSKRCVHLTYDMGDEGPVRCPAIADTLAQNGWLCAAHNAQMSALVKSSKVVRHRDKDSEMIDSLLGVEARAIQRGVREKVRLLTKGVYIHYLS